jgi:hypothetical protein
MWQMSRVSCVPCCVRLRFSFSPPCVHACQVDYILTDSAERAECPPGYFRNTTIDPTLQQGQLTVPTKVCGLYRL